MGLFDDVLDNVGEPYKGGKGFEYGTHEVIIGSAEAKAKKTKTVDAAAIIEVVVFDETDNDKSATCTLWFHTDGAAKMSLTKILGLLVHSVGDEKKDKVRELGKKLFGSIDDPVKARDVAAKLMADRLIGKKAFLVAEPQGKYTTTSYGDLWHYAAEPQSAEERAERAATAAAVGGEDITAEATDDLPKFDGDDGGDL